LFMKKERKRRVTDPASPERNKTRRARRRRAVAPTP